MLIAESLSSLQLVLLGLGILVVAFVLRRGIVLGRRSRGRDVADEVRKERCAAEQSSVAQIRKLEVRLHDYSREIEGQMQTRISMLNQLVVEADREIGRLRQLLQTSRRTETATAMRRGPDIVGPPTAVNAAEPSGASHPVSPSTDAQRRMVWHLQQAGYSAEQIGKLTDRPEAEVRAILEGDEFRDAA